MKLKTLSGVVNLLWSPDHTLYYTCIALDYSHAAVVYKTCCDFTNPLSVHLLFISPTAENMKRMTRTMVGPNTERENAGLTLTQK